jgi:hypothetical protein
MLSPHTGHGRRPSAAAGDGGTVPSGGVATAGVGVLPSGGVATAGVDVVAAGLAGARTGDAAGGAGGADGAAGAARPAAAIAAARCGDTSMARSKRTK